MVDNLLGSAGAVLPPVSPFSTEVELLSRQRSYMAIMRRLSFCLFVACLLGIAPVRLRAFDVGPGAGLRVPDLLELSGYITEAPPAAPTIGSVTLGTPDRQTLLLVSKVQVRNNGLTEGISALRGVQLYNPNLRLVGDQELLRTIERAAPQTELTLFGYLNIGSRRLFVVSVEPHNANKDRS